MITPEDVVNNVFDLKNDPDLEQLKNRLRTWLDYLIEDERMLSTLYILREAKVFGAIAERTSNPKNAERFIRVRKALEEIADRIRRGKITQEDLHTAAGMAFADDCNEDEFFRNLTKINDRGLP